MYKPEVVEVNTKMSNGAAANRDRDCPKVHLSIGDKYIPVDVIEDTTTTHKVVERIKNEQIEEVSSVQSTYLLELDMESYVIATAAVTLLNIRI